MHRGLAGSGDAQPSRELRTETSDGAPLHQGEDGKREMMPSCSKADEWQQRRKRNLERRTEQSKNERSLLVVPDELENGHGENEDRKRSWQIPTGTSHGDLAVSEKLDRSTATPWAEKSRTGRREKN
jgi:hypothetical protein